MGPIIKKKKAKKKRFYRRCHNHHNLIWNIASPQLEADPIASLLVLPLERVSRKSMKDFEVSFVDHQIQQPKTNYMNNS